MVGGRDVVPLIGRVGVIESANGSKAFAQLYAALALRHFGADLSKQRASGSRCPPPIASPGGRCSIRRVSTIRRRGG